MSDQNFDQNHFLITMIDVLIIIIFLFVLFLIFKKKISRKFFPPVSFISESIALNLQQDCIENYNIDFENQFESEIKNLGILNFVHDVKKKEYHLNNLIEMSKDEHFIQFGGIIYYASLYSPSFSIVNSNSRRTSHWIVLK